LKKIKKPYMEKGGGGKEEKENRSLFYLLGAGGKKRKSHFTELGQYGKGGEKKKGKPLFCDKKERCFS